MHRGALLCLLGGWVFMLHAAAPAAVPYARQGETRSVAPRITGEERALVRQLHAARKDGDAARVTGIQNALHALRAFRMQDHGAGAALLPVAEPPGPAALPGAWGSDVLISDGVFGALSPRGLATDVDTGGTIYVGGIHAGTGTDTVRIFRSTDLGLTWAAVGSYHFPGKKIQSFALHVTDTVGGTLVGTIASVVNPASRQDGALWWASFRGNGTGFRSHLILNPVGPLGFNHPALVSDGFEFSPGVTWWYAAAAVVDSNGISDAVLALRSTDFGRTWPYIDTVRAGFDDGFPSIDYENVVTSASGTSRPDAALPAAGIFLDTIAIDANMRIGALHVRIDSLLHPTAEDLDVFLFSPWGDSVELFTDVGGTGNDFIGTLLTDSAGTRITAGTAPFTGAWKPEASNVPSGAFNVWEGYFGAGDWVLRVVDDAAPDAGRLVRWSLWIDPFSSEEVYISTITDFGTDTDLRLFKSDAVIGGYSGWDFNALTVDPDDDVEADLAAGRAEGNLLIVNTHVTGADADIRYHASTDGGLTWSGPETLAAGPGNQWFPSVAVLQDFDPVPYNVAYLDRGDSVIVLESADIGNLGAAPRRGVNDELPSIAVRPEIGAHAAGSGPRSHLVYFRNARGIYYDGEETATAAKEVEQTPSAISLAQNYPNPFNPSTRIVFSLTARSDVRLTVVDVLGREVRTLLREARPAGTHEVLFDAAGLAGGVYYYTLRAAGRVETRKMLLLR